MKEKKFNLSDRFKKKEMNIDKETTDKLMNDTASEEANQIVNEIVHEEIKKRYVRATVVGCNKLNVRFTPKLDGSVIGILTNGDEVEVNTSYDDPDFYSIVMPLGLEGYCMKKYIALK